jgi:hypothetical protein
VEQHLGHSHRNSVGIAEDVIGERVPDQRHQHLGFCQEPVGGTSYAVRMTSRVAADFHAARSGIEISMVAP